MAAKSAENSGKDDRTNERKDAEMGDREGGGRAHPSQHGHRSKPKGWRLSGRRAARRRAASRGAPAATPVSRTEA